MASYSEMQGLFPSSREWREITVAHPEQQAAPSRFLGGRLITCILALGAFVASAGAGHFLVSLAAAPGKHLSSTAPQSGEIAFTMSRTKTWEDCAPASNPILEVVDLVAYFSLDKDAPARHGTPEHESEYGGYTFLFESAENKAKFEANPVSYFPKFGGFCSWGVARESFWKAYNLGPFSDPDFWLITEGLLYIFRSETPKVYFEKDLASNIQAGNRNWSKWWGSDSTPGADSAGSPLNTNCFCSVETCVDA